LGAGAAAVSLPGVSRADIAFPKGAVIRTVLKDVMPESLAGGATLFHEHMALASDFMPRWMAASRATSGRGGATPPAPAASSAFFMEDLDLMTEELKTAATEGVACIADGGHPDMGRNFDFLKQLSEKSGMPIVAGGGFYSQPFYPAEIGEWSEE